jgi:hypothetical protein
MIVGYTILAGMSLEEFSNHRLHLDGAFGVMRNIEPRVECGLTGGCINKMETLNMLPTFPTYRE